MNKCIQNLFFFEIATSSFHQINHKIEILLQRKEEVQPLRVQTSSKTILNRTWKTKKCKKGYWYKAWGRTVELQNTYTRINHELWYLAHPNRVYASYIRKKLFLLLNDELVTDDTAWCLFIVLRVLDNTSVCIC